MVLSAGEGVVLITGVILLEVSLEPLAELEVVEVAGLDELANINVPLDSVLVEGVLEDLVVVDELVLVLGSPLDSREGERVRVERVEDGAVDGARSTLLDLGELKLYRAKRKNTRVG